MSDSVYYWVFYASSGDAYYGALVDDSVEYYEGFLSVTANGYYEVYDEIEYGYDLDVSGLTEGMVFTDVYYDGGTAQAVSTLSAGTYPTGTLGLGSEYDYIAASGGSDDFGYGGAVQADVSSAGADSYYVWYFVAYSGDEYGGYLFDNSSDFAVGQVIDTGYGYYYVAEEYPYGYDLTASGYEDGLLQVTYYYDLYQGYLAVYNQSVGVPSSTVGFGGEYDYAWNGAYWDDFGVGGAAQAGYYG